jgi:His/Glu/Gln/Arg/opine family amino acid ABC transporter permease subunit
MLSKRWQRRAVGTVSWLFILLVCLWLVRGLRWNVVWQASPFLLKGLLVSWELAIISVLIGLVAGIGLAAARLYGAIGVRHIAIGYVELIRSIPQIMVIFWVFFGIPAVTGYTLDPMPAAIIALSTIASAYLAEVIRAGLLSVSRVHRESGYCSGISFLDIFLHIVLPQAMRNMLPALLAHIVMMFKLTALVYLIGLIDFFRAIILVNNREYAPEALYLTMAVVYFVCNFILSSIVRSFDPKYGLVA